MAYLRRSHLFPQCVQSYKILFPSYFSSFHPEKKISVSFPDRPDLEIGCTEYAGFADGCAIAKIGNTSVMVTAVSRTKSSPSLGFLPLTVDYKQKAAAAGRIPLNAIRRDSFTTEPEILASRLIDRSLRPLFQGYTCETQIICNLLAVDGVYDPEVTSINAASAALSLSDIPWNGPVGAVRVGLINDQVVINPSRRELLCSTLDMVVVAAAQNLVIMLEAAGKNILQQDFLKAIKTGVKECQKIVSSISQLQKQYGKPKRALETVSYDSLLDGVRSLVGMKVRSVFQDYTHDKLSRDDAIKEIRSEFLEKLKQDQPEVNSDFAGEAFNIVTKEIFRQIILDNKTRCDGRRLTELRNIKCDVDMFEPLHGSAFFQRGQTQVLCTVTLDSSNSALHLDPMSALLTGQKDKEFILHYEFPPYATKEVGRPIPGRREIGHGALAEKGIRPVIPKDYPFTVRLTSEVLQSNGSSSMATVCGGSMALMDAGVPISSPVAGVAIGLVTKYEGNDTKHISNYQLLTDILGIEDYMGDMDFKIAGTKKGITSLQADIKIPGLPLKIVMEAVQAGCDAKSEIINIMNSTISTHRKQRKESWPVVETFNVPIHLRAKFIGPGGVNIKRILVETGVQITSKEDDGTYQIFAPSQAAMDEAKEQIKALVEASQAPLLEFGGIYQAKIQEIRESGVMVILYDSMKPTLLPNSQLDVRKVSDASVLGFEVGQEIQVRYFGVDPVSGQMRLSRKALQSTASTVSQNLIKS